MTMQKGNYVTPLLKFAENLEHWEGFDFGSFAIRRIKDTFEILFGNQTVKYTWKELNSYLKDGVLIDGIMSLNLFTMTLDIRILPLEEDRYTMNKALRLIIENKMDFELVSKEGLIINSFNRGIDSTGKVGWIDNSFHCYPNLDLKFVELGTLRIEGIDEKPYELTDVYVKLYNVSYEVK